MDNAQNSATALAVAQPTADVVVDGSTTIVLSQKYNFEGKEYATIDLSGLENLTAQTMIQADKFLNRSGNFSILPEMSLEYTLFVAANASGLPVEFFYQLKPRDALRVKNAVTGFFYSAE
jgi:hypothetical protein